MIFLFMLFLGNLLGLATLNLFLISTLLFGYCFISFSTKPVQAMMNAVLLFSVLVGSEFIFVIFAEITDEHSALKLSSMPWLTFGSKLLSFIILQMIKQFSNRSKGKLTTRVFWMYLCLPAASLGMMVTIYRLSQSEIKDMRVKVALTLCFALMLLGNILVFAAFNRYAANLHHSMQQDWLIASEKMNRKYYEKMTDLNDERQALIHDMTHYITALRAFVQSDEKNAALEMLKDLSANLEENELHVYSKIPFLDTFLTEKKAYAEDKSIPFLVYVEPGVQFNQIKKTDYLVMLGNLIDNAIQASEHCTDMPFVKVTIFMENEGSFLVSKIVNNFNDDYLCIKDGEYLTTKKEEGIHGLGLKSVMRMAEKSNANFSTYTKENQFHAVLAVPNRMH